MPGRDQTGPTGGGPKIGRGQGKCESDSAPEKTAEQEKEILIEGRGRRRRQRRGRRGGRGQGGGGGRGQGGPDGRGRGAGRAPRSKPSQDA